MEILEKKLWNLNVRCILEKGPKILNNLEVDASNTGGGGILNEQLLAPKLFSEEEREANSVWGGLANVLWPFGFFTKIEEFKSQTFCRQ